jgi:hypothetical protein
LSNIPAMATTFDESTLDDAADDWYDRVPCAVKVKQPEPFRIVRQTRKILPKPKPLLEELMKFATDLHENAQTAQKLSALLRNAKATFKGSKSIKCVAYILQAYFEECFTLEKDGEDYKVFAVPNVEPKLKEEEITRLALRQVFVEPTELEVGEEYDVAIVPSQPTDRNAMTLVHFSDKRSLFYALYTKRIKEIMPKSNADHFALSPPVEGTLCLHNHERCVVEKIMASGKSAQLYGLDTGHVYVAPFNEIYDPVLPAHFARFPVRAIPARFAMEKPLTQQLQYKLDKYGKKLPFAFWKARIVSSEVVVIKLGDVVTGQLVYNVKLGKDDLCLPDDIGHRSFVV